MTKKFSRLQLLSIIDGRLSTQMGDIYDMLNHIFDDENFFTHSLPGAFDKLKQVNPEWFQKEKQKLEEICRSLPVAIPIPFNSKEIDFKLLTDAIKEKYNDMVDVPQMKDLLVGV